jgi:hypothetical protein
MILWPVFVIAVPLDTNPSTLPHLGSRGREAASTRKAGVVDIFPRDWTDPGGKVAQAWRIGARG